MLAGYPCRTLESLGFPVRTAIILPVRPAPAIPPKRRERPRAFEVSDGWFFLALLAVLLAFYIPTAKFEYPYHIDAEANVFTAWSIATNRTPFLDGFTDLTQNDFEWPGHHIITGLDDRPVSKYPPGAALLAAPLYLLAPDAPLKTVNHMVDNDEIHGYIHPVPSLVPGGLVAALSSAVGVAALGVVMKRRHGWRIAAISALTLGLGTTIWSIAANMLWQHGPNIMWLGLGLLAADSSKFILAGWSFGAAILTRPQTAVAVAVVGAVIAWKQRSVRTLMGIGLPAACGLALYAYFNLKVFGEVVPHAAGGYWLANPLEGASYAEGLLRTFLDPERGVLLWSPAVGLAIPRLRQSWVNADVLTKAAAFGAVVYLLLQLRGNIWSGGGNFYAYRYAIEPLFLSTLLLMPAIASYARASHSRHLLAVFLLMLSVAIHWFGAVIS